MATVEELQKQARARGADIKRILNSPDGRKLLDYMREAYGANPHHVGDPHVTSFNCGQLSVVQELDELSTTDFTLGEAE